MRAAGKASRMGRNLRNILVSLQVIDRNIIDRTKDDVAQKEDFENMNRSRARLIEWIILEDYGTKISRENGIASEAIEAYGFPPIIRY